MHHSANDATNHTAGPQLQLRLTTEISTVRAELTRCDTKAIALLTLAAHLLLPGVTVLAAGRVHGSAAGLGWTAAFLLLAAIGLLFLAKFPRLGGRFGFVRWAAAGDAATLLDEITGEVRDGDPYWAAAGELHRLSVLAHGKYRAIQTAMLLLVLALTAAALTALTVWAR